MNTHINRKSLTPFKLAPGREQNQKLKGEKSFNFFLANEG